MADLYKINKFTGQLDNTGDPAGGGGNTTKWESFTLDGTDIANKYVTLAGPLVDNQSIRVFIDDVGIKAEQGIDYSISSLDIIWTGLLFDGLLEVGDKLKIFYV